jgi:hypothetical protein
MKTKKLLTKMALMIGLMLFAFSGWGQIAAWNFTGVGSTTLPTFAATTFDENMISTSGASNITRGPGAAWSAGNNSFRTTGFQNNGISTANTDYFQITLTASEGYQLSLSTVDARFAGTATFAASPGVSSQFAYSLDGVNFSLIGSHSTTIGTPATLPQIDLTSVVDLQNVEAGTTVTIRYYASGQTATGGWGFNSPSAGINGLAIGGEVTPAGAIVATPQFNPPAGTYYAPQTVAIITSTEEASIFYTLDGSDPDDTNTEYTDPIVISSTTTLKARAYKEGYDPSNIAIAFYHFPPITNVANIATLRAGTADGIAGYNLNGEAILKATNTFNNRMFIEDESAAIMIFDPSGIITGTYELGDGITNITGVLTAVNNMLRFVPVLNPGPASSTGNPVVPSVFGLGELTTDDQAKLVKVENVTFTSTGNFANGQNYTITDGTNNLIVRTDFFDVDYIGTAIPTAAQNLTGVIIQFNDNLQIVPRFLADFEDTVFDVDPPAAFTATAISSSAIELAFDQNTEGNDVVIVYNDSGEFSEPEGDIPAEPGADFAGGFLLYNGKDSPVTHDGLDAEQTVYYRIWSFDGDSFSPGLDANATTEALEPSNHVTDFAAMANSHNAITVSWTDAVPAAAGYLIKGSADSFEAIIAPVDGTPEANAALVSNVGPAVETYQFTGLDPATEYFFKIFPYNGNGAAIKYKTGGVVPEASAITGEAPAEPEVFTQWDFDASNLTPNIGSGTAVNIGGTSSAFAGGAPGLGWNTSAYPAQLAASGTAGVEFMVSTLGFESITLSFDLRASGTASRWAQIEYTLDGGENWVVFSDNDGGLSPHDTFYPFEFDFTGIPEANNNAAFGLRIVSIFSPLAFNQNTTLSYGPNEAYMRANTQAKYAPDPGEGTGNYGTGGTWRFDNVTFSGFPIIPEPAAKLAVIDVNGGFSPNVNATFELTVQSQDELGIPSNVDTDTEVSLSVFTGTGVLGGTLTATITAGTNLVVFENMTYSVAEAGIVIQAETTAGMELESGVSAEFEVLSPATQLVFVDVPEFGVINTNISSFTVEARNAGDAIDPNFAGIVHISKADGLGQVTGTLSAELVNGIATFNNISFTEAGPYSLFADVDGLPQATSEFIMILPEPSITGILIPQYISGNAPTDNRIPFAFRAKIENLIPGATYKYINQVVIAADSPTTNGAGNTIFFSESGDFLQVSGPTFTNPVLHSEFTAGADGEFEGWFGVEPTNNAKFTPGNEVFMRIRINDGAGGTTHAYYLTVEEGISVLGFGTEAEATLGTAIRGVTESQPKNFMFLYHDNFVESTRPLFGTTIETTGLDFGTLTGYTAFYRDEVFGNDGAWGGIIPNTNENGVRLLEERSLADGSVVATYESENGVWGATNTANPNGGLVNVLVIDFSVPEVPETLNVSGITITAMDEECFAATDLIVVSDFVVENGGSATFVTGPQGSIKFMEGVEVMENGYLRAWIDPLEQYCFQDEIIIVVKNEEMQAAEPELIPVRNEKFFKVYPNPNTGVFSLELNESQAASSITVEIYGMLGERLLSQELSGASLYRLDMSAMPRGMYILRVLKGQEVEVQRIIKQ